MTEEEHFCFDTAGFLVRPAILAPEQIAAIIDQIDYIKHDPGSLLPAHRATPGGPSNMQHIGPDIRLESSVSVWREQGEAHGELHGGGPQQGDPIFGYPVRNGRIHAGMVRVIFELTDVTKDDGGTHFIVGSHKCNFPMHPDHMSLEMGKRSPFLMTYEYPAGSAIFFTENLCHTGPEWRRSTPMLTLRPTGIG